LKLEALVLEDFFHFQHPRAPFRMRDPVREKRTSGAEALGGTNIYGTAEAVPFVKRCSLIRKRKWRHPHSRGRSKREWLKPSALNVEVAADHSKMLAVLVVGPRERSWRARQVRASVVEKLRAAWVR
jgi:hypothetical protein